ncbi:hypothetical protein E4U13_005895 [Claviceps humidiphila]|uniref:Uncharacterized protein n=1 Tax=Claviceps humidiphila TaxID=1294629 RepID=A0A9P7PVB7_9HYPO|nr:hypothetical protein E4U13_005895 [Claviceps humidiphila]
MFATQQCLDTVDSGRKRLRDDEDLPGAAAALGVHRDCLTTPIIPLNASPAVAGPRHTIDTWTPDPMGNFARKANAELERMTMAQSTPPGHDETSVDISSFRDIRPIGQTSTPIHSNFAAQVWGQDAGCAVPLQAATASGGMVNLGDHIAGDPQDNCTPRPIMTDAERHMQSLPSPKAEIVVPIAGNSCGMTVEESNNVNALLSRLAADYPDPPSHQPSPTRAMEHPNAMKGTKLYLKSGTYLLSDAEPASPFPGRRGHQRSKHVVHSWTWQPGMKRTFSMGYRSDCEQCRLKVPGHLNHIVIS